jgi:mannose-6-phosphate isomerase-like protein (cupin superfamily)
LRLFSGISLNTIPNDIDRGVGKEYGAGYSVNIVLAEFKERRSPMAEALNSPARVVLSPKEGETVWLRKLGIRFMIGGDASGGTFALVEHPIGPRALAAPMHTHEREDEYTYVLEGEVGFQIGEEVLLARSGDLVFKPRGVPHAFWNATDEPARALEIISPAGFERYFAELAPLFPPANEGPLDQEAVGAVREKYGLEMDMGSIPVLAERHGLLVDAPPHPDL